MCSSEGNGRMLSAGPDLVRLELSVVTDAPYNASMLVRDIGEFELIALLESRIRKRNRVQIEKLRALGVEVELEIGDDAAAWTQRGARVVSTTDTMVEGVHFKTATTRWPELGWKAMASNLSDVASMGCSPTLALVTLGLRGDIPVSGLTDMYDGMMDSCEYAGGAIIGGDIVRSDTFFVTVALEGVCDAGSHVLSRGAAQVGDLIGVTGHLGCSAGGLALLLDAEAGRGVSDESRTHLIGAHNQPMPRVAEGRALREIGVRCAMDVSDGLTADLGKLCAASGVSAVVEADRLPADAYLKKAFPNRWRELALGGGEDYEIVFTTNAGIMESASERLGERISVIGRIEDGDGMGGGKGGHPHPRVKYGAGSNLPPSKERGLPESSPVRILDTDGSEIEIGSGGWDHFAGRHG